ncbi:hypothetical protein VST7929_01074 [Vibrio stylophorae]|uniref:DUF305 domain-containing protein n=1 Tax=Vibrio stylophorae TaxID=659351 RepID=A0ABM8ZTH1_9VIBR|nr:DUF305 domain-containing protein [Vibrio stylophorae]CAH0533210.1 hypothetical protein VST7929_01074 [Vibrio stylophorae]
MKKVRLSLLLAALLSSSAVFAHDAHHDESHGISASQAMMHDSMTAMHGMHTLKLTGMPSYDFVAGMLPHHEGAIVMSEKILPSLTDPQIKQLAENIIKSQQHEVAFMKQWLADHQTINPKDVNMKASEAMMSQSMAVMHGMMTVKLTGNPNVDFVQGMLPHHEAAIKMAEVVMPYLKNQQIKTFAQNIITAQQHEVAFMKAWLATQIK